MQLSAVDARCVTTAHGAIVFDRRRLPQVDERWLEPNDSADAARGGRGAVWRVDTPAGRAVLRHYRRGGAVARISADRYLWAGAGRTRSFAEFELLSTLLEMGLPVPPPLAARYRRCDPLRYTADLLTLEIPGARTLAELFPAVLEDAGAIEQLGLTLARFHRAGASHADLNAHNILLDRNGQWWLIDFDRGQLRAPRPGWWARRMDRLERSWRKLGVLQQARGLSAWRQLRAVHDAAAGVGR
ncbi:3-deoxy-D-manno-octulosonic acid kinase [Pseudomarimonas salicorniae]|uniref:3-deoxy-D-manno-octulosonic acid kinase n=1 Tax=Pseudomarimonas salicorniae TaxID=2933270 RepID=A0ABT0GFE1_9GAMM|nr:3-deoxy-D-manno-octulosonic acid kinase [Lysobacter sp. CAU 1642]MCK7593259.1 3-deoxy-D-manno-octulosonic acid kinase [Lysobacter sp. CAU 1642]